MKKTARILLFFIVMLPLLTARLHAAADISVVTVVERQEAAVGEPIAMQIQVTGSDSAKEPDLSAIDAFHIQPRGGQSTNSTQITNSNGSWQRISKLGYIFNYTITPKRSGRLTLPSLAVTVDGTVYKTEPMTIVVSKPRETEDFKLRLFLSSAKCFVGEPITMIATWFVGKDVNNFEFQLPILDDPRFELVPQNMQARAGTDEEEIKIPVANDTLIALKGRGQLADREFLTVTFQYLLVPREAGTLTLPQATVACQTPSGFRQSRRRSPFGGFGDIFGSSREPVYRTLVIPSNEPTLTVLPLPQKDMPQTFSGLVGKYSISAEAKPTEVNIGDPITLTIRLKGPYVRPAQLPELSRFLPSSSFKIPTEIAPGQVAENEKTFTQTIRVKDASVTQIPSLELVYFDPEEKSFHKAETDPIALTVHATRVVTAEDAQGRTASVAHQELKAAQKALAFNYEGNDVLLNQQVDEGTAKGWLPLVFVLPPVFFLLTGIFSHIRKKRLANPAQRLAQTAFSRLEKELAAPSLSTETIYTCLKKYLGARLRKKAGAITFSDVERDLASLGAGENTLAQLRELLESFEACQYAGHSGTMHNLNRLKENTLEVANKLESHFS